MAEKRAGVLGATSLTGECLLPMLCGAGYEISAFSREPKLPSGVGISWHRLDEERWPRLPYWISAAPIWVLPNYFERLQAVGARRIVVLSSTSRFTKEKSSDPGEQEVARRLAAAEANLQEWAERNGIEWVILRPTLIYGLGRDKNIAEIATFIRRFRFFPILGHATGFRQPIHALDVAAACLSALESPRAAKRAYNLSGGETLSYREMVNRVFSALNRRPNLVTIPLSAFRCAVPFSRLFPRGRNWSAGMAERMNRDLVFESTEARRDLDISPGMFRLNEEDLPP